MAAHAGQEAGRPETSARTGLGACRCCELIHKTLVLMPIAKLGAGPSASRSCKKSALMHSDRSSMRHERPQLRHECPAARLCFRTAVVDMWPQQSCAAAGFSTTDQKSPECHAVRVFDLDRMLPAVWLLVCTGTPRCTKATLSTSCYEPEGQAGLRLLPLRLLPLSLVLLTP